ncbi:MAG: leucine-rich repeat domain-containing protein, partial [Candidatus Thorarchaeota archaeon]|nr:leucine-rich repeat domain-containing protein [Candidatus Thorarchaeota archaeon]
QEECKFTCDDEKIDLHMRAATSIDLSPVSKCHDLKELDLSHNQLTGIDLGPLSNLQELERLSLRDNHLSELDLWPLITCKSFKHLELASNRLRQLDATPLFRCSHVELDSFVVVIADELLRYILDGSRLQETFKSLRTDYELESSWTATPVVIFRDYRELSRTLGWQVTLSRIRLVLKHLDTKYWYPAQRGLLGGLGMAELAGYDGSPLQIISGAAKCQDFESARDAIYDSVVDLLQNQIAKKGPTHFLDVERMRGTRASKLIPQITDRRSEEMSEAVVQKMEGTAYLHSLWLTSYGHNLLSAMHAGLRMRCEDLDLLRNALSTSGFEIRESRVVEPPQLTSSNFSESFLSHMEALAEASGISSPTQYVSRLEQK